MNGNVEASSQNGTENDEGENAPESGRGTPCELNDVSQIDLVRRFFVHHYVQLRSKQPITH